MLNYESYNIFHILILNIWFIISILILKTLIKILIRFIAGRVVFIESVILIFKKNKWNITESFIYILTKFSTKRELISHIRRTDKKRNIIYRYF